MSLYKMAEKQVIKDKHLIKIFLAESVSFRNYIINSILCKSHFFLVYCTIILLCYYFQLFVITILMSIYYGLQSGYGWTWSN